MRKNAIYAQHIRSMNFKEEQVMSILKKGFNMFAEGGTALNRMINQAIGKDVFKDIKKIEEPREFPPFCPKG